jgi:hypothetical protein
MLIRRLSVMTAAADSAAAGTGGQPNIIIAENNCHAQEKPAAGTGSTDQGKDGAEKKTRRRISGSGLLDS